MSDMRSTLIRRAMIDARRMCGSMLDVGWSLSPGVDEVTWIGAKSPVDDQ